MASRWVEVQVMWTYSPQAALITGKADLERVVNKSVGMAPRWFDALQKVTLITRLANLVGGYAAFGTSANVERIASKRKGSAIHLLRMEIRVKTSIRCEL